MLSTKNQLQQYFQIRKLPLPVYETKHMGGPPHSPLFCSFLTLHDEKKFESELFSNKREAEKNAAAKALFYIQSQVKKEEQKEKREFDLWDDVNILLDMESKPMLGEKIEKYIFSSGDGRIILNFFASSDHPTLRKKFERANIIETPTSHKDGVDIHIACSAIVDDEGPYSTIILTHDHFGVALVEILQKYYHLNAYCASSFEGLCSIMEEIVSQQ